MKELGSGITYNTHNTTSLIRTLKYVSDILQTEEAFTVEEYKHTHTMTKLFSPSFRSQNESTDYITFVQTYNPNTKFNKNIINNSLNDFHDNSLKKAFVKKKPLLATKQGKSLQNLLIRTRFVVVPKPIAPTKNVGLCNCQDKRCLLHCHNYNNPCFAKNLNLNLNLGDTIFGNTTVILTVKAEM